MNSQDECPVECPFGQVILDTNLTNPDILEKILTVTSWGKEGMLTGLLLFVDCRVPSEKLYRFVLMALIRFSIHYTSAITINFSSRVSSSNGNFVNDIR